MLVKPSTLQDPRMVVFGAGQVYFGPYTANGGDASLTFLGATKGGVSMHYARTIHDVETDQALAAVKGFPTKEEVMFKFTLLQLNLGNVYAAIGSTEMPLVGGGATDASSSLGFGQAITPVEKQFVWYGMAPPGATNLQRVLQAWKAMVTDIGEIKMEKNGEASVALTVKAYYDVTAFAALGNSPIFKILDS
jgi:hypothetical protein